jgi:hypothetical protein
MSPIPPPPPPPPAANATKTKPVGNPTNKGLLGEIAAGVKLRGTGQNKSNTSSALMEEIAARQSSSAAADKEAEERAEKIAQMLREQAKTKATKAAAEKVADEKAGLIGDTKEARLARRDAAEAKRAAGRTALSNANMQAALQERFKGRRKAVAGEKTKPKNKPGKLSSKAGAAVARMFEERSGGTPPKNMVEEGDRINPDAKKEARAALNAMLSAQRSPPFSYGCSCGGYTSSITD